MIVFFYATFNMFLLHIDTGTVHFLIITNAVQGLKKVKAQGFGANTDDEMDQYGKNDMQALSEMLGNKASTTASLNLCRKTG